MCSVLLCVQYVRHTNDFKRVLFSQFFQIFKKYKFNYLLYIIGFKMSSISLTINDLLCYIINIPQNTITLIDYLH